MVIGKNIYDVIKCAFKNNNGYYFRLIDEYLIDNNSEIRYPIYSVVSKNEYENDNRIKLYKNIV